MTTHRVILHARGRRAETSTSILLSHVQWTQLVRVSHRPLVLIAAALGLLTLLMAATGQLVLVWPLAVALVVVVGTAGASWSRARVVVGGGDRQLSLPLEPNPRRRRQAQELVDLIERAAAEASRHGQVLYPI